MSDFKIEDTAQRVFKISTTLQNRSVLTSILGTTKISDTSNRLGTIGSTGARGDIGPTGAQGSGGVSIADTVIITDNTTVLSLSTSTTRIINYTATGLFATLPRPTTGNTIKTIIATAGSLTTRLNTSTGTYFLDGGEYVVLAYTQSTGIWNLIEKTGDGFPRTQVGTDFFATDYIGTDISQGQSVSVSADGSTIAWGGNGDNSGVGAVWVFVLNPTSGTWVQQAKLVGTGGIGSGNI